MTDSNVNGAFCQAMGWNRTTMGVVGWKMWSLLIVQLLQIKPAMDELGLVSPDQMGYDKPEFFQPSPENWWEHKWYKQYGYDKIHGYEF